MTEKASPYPVLACVLIVLGTVLGIAGIDLVLPAVPTLHEHLPGSEETAQLVIASYVAGSGTGLILFGVLGERFGRRRCLVLALLAYGLLSGLATLSPDMLSLLAVRFVQGLASAAPAVFAPGIIRALFSEQGATRAIGALSSIESLTPAGAPIAGLWLVQQGGWKLPFFVTAALAIVLSVVFIAWGGILPPSKDSARGKGSYWRLMASPVFMRYGLSQALVVGGLLVFVFGAPAVIVNSMGGTMMHFITMQVVGISCFIIASNTTGSLVKRFGPEPMISFGTGMAATGAVLVLLFALFGNGDPIWLAPIFVLVNAGLGFRGPPGFLRAIMAGKGDDDRASSTTILGIFAVAAGGTALVSPFIDQGLLPLAIAGAGLQLLAVLALLVLPEYSREAEPVQTVSKKSTKPVSR
ncbi:MFS transporter [Henriciella sp. AS95]|uniref:MFS transporter n=1 Tax=Henriciella sp. AS95 TaxID=3135782 RepID=UPI00316D0854